MPNRGETSQTDVVKVDDRLTPGDRRILKCLEDVADDDGCAREDQWFNACRRAGANEEADRKAFARAVTNMLECGAIRIKGDMVYLQ
jgi:hypothetical protein